MTAPRKPKPPRNGELAMIHMAKAQLGLDDATYRDMLWTLAQVRSSAALDHAGRRKVLEHLKSRGARIGRAGQGRAPADRARLLDKITAQLADLHLPEVYAEGIARQMFGVQRLNFCTPAMLAKIVAALAYKQKAAS
ncbi:MAG: regulatory protein GemA [Sulfuritalea sp.]|nr:regulatory protein GemA [Sulfuritalea sp.]